MIKYESFVYELDKSPEILVVLSLGFRKVLKQMIKQHNIIAKKIYQTHKNKISSISYIDMSKDINQITYTRYYQIIDELNDNNIDPLNKDDVYNFRYGWTHNRNNMKIGKLVNKLYPSTFSKKEIEDFVNLYKSYTKSMVDSKLDLVYGFNIKHWYLNDNYLKGGGTLNRSCLRKKEKNDFINFFVGNSKICRLIILKNKEDKLLGRALLWKLSNNKKFMDRIYTRFDEDVNIFIKLAMDHNWYYKSKQTFGNVPIVDSSNNEVKKMIMIIDNFESKNFKGYPYMDTFQFYNPKTKILTNDENVFTKDSGFIKLNQVDGSYQTYEDSLRAVDIDIDMLD